MPPMTKTRPIKIDYSASDFLGGTILLDAWEELAFRRICDLIYVTRDNLPDDNKLGQLTKVGRRWTKIRARLIELEKIDVINGKISQPRCRRELQDAEARIYNAKRAGMASGKKRKQLKDNITDLTGVSPHVATEHPTPEATTHQPSPIKERKKPPAPNGAGPPTIDVPPIPNFLRRTKEPKNASTGTKKRKTGLAPDWGPNAQHFVLGSELGFDEGQVYSQADQYRDHAGMHGRTLVDWDKGFNNWLRKAAEFAGRGPSSAGSGQAGSGGRGDTGVVAALRELKDRREAL